jgi:hypothetical protein
MSLSWRLTANEEKQIKFSAGGSVPGNLHGLVAIARTLWSFAPPQSGPITLSRIFPPYTDNPGVRPTCVLSGPGSVCLAEYSSAPPMRVRSGKSEGTAAVLRLCPMEPRSRSMARKARLAVNPSMIGVCMSIASRVKCESALVRKRRRLHLEPSSGRTRFLRRSTGAIGKGLQRPPARP